MSADIRSELVDQLISAYCDWREHCRDVHAAYDRFAKAVAPTARRLAFDAYRSALDSEEHASYVYADQLKLVELAYD
jgi:hypothetical protein